jgi:hypothetical protein
MRFFHNLIYVEYTSLVILSMITLRNRSGGNFKKREICKIVSLKRNKVCQSNYLRGIACQIRIFAWALYTFPYAYLLYYFLFVLIMQKILNILKNIEKSLYLKFNILLIVLYNYFEYVNMRSLNIILCTLAQPSYYTFYLANIYISHDILIRKFKNKKFCFSLLICI